MLDFINFLFELLGDFFTFLNDFELLPNLSIFRIFIIILLLNIAYKFLFTNKGGGD